MIKSASKYLFFIFGLLACNKENAADCFKSNGKTVSEVRYPEPFHSLIVNDKIEVTVFKGSEYKVEVIAGKHLLKGIKTRVLDNELIIENTNKCNFVRGYKHRIKVYVTSPYIKKATNEGVSALTFDEQFNQDTLMVRCGGIGDVIVNGTFNVLFSSTHGGGDTYLNGSCNTLWIYANGTNYIHAQHLEVKNYIFIQTLSLGDITINANGLNQLDYNIESSGNIIYHGVPTILKNAGKQEGGGKAIPAS